jgi:flagellar motor switch protein FliM
MVQTGRPKAPTPYDFRRPNKFNREHVRTLQIASETFARQFSTVLSTTLRAVSQVSHEAVNQLTYDEYIRNIPNPSYLAILNLEPLNGTSVLNVSLPVMMAMIDRLLGGSGAGDMPSRPLSEIEQALAKGLLERVLRELAYAFESLTPLQPSIVHQEANPQFAQAVAASDMVIVLTFDIRVGHHSGEVTLCVPFAALQPVLDAVTAEATRSSAVLVEPEAVKNALVGNLDAAAVDVAIRFHEVVLPSTEIVALRPGDILPLLHPVDAPLAVSVAGVNCFQAMPGRKGKRLACLIVDPDRRDN